MWPADADRVGNLIAWLESAGAAIGPVGVERYADGSRGLRAVADIAAGQVVLQVPRSCMICVDIADKSDIRSQLDSAGASLDSDHSCFAALLLREKHNPDTSWKAELDVLPARYPDCPILFEEKELSLLQASMALRDIEQRKRVLRSDHALLCRHVSGFDRFSYEQFVWAFWSVTSRLFGLKIGERTVHAMVPLADMANHRNPPDLSWAYDDATAGFVMKADRDIAAGQAVCISYGNKCNSRLLVNQGFCLADNDENCAEVDLPDAARNHPLAHFAWVFGYPGFDGTRRFRVVPQYDAWMTKQMFSFLRLSCASGEDVRRLTRLGFDRPEIGPVSRGNETSVLLTLADACHTALAAFPTSLEDDLDLLGSPDLAANARNCILMRSGEKRVLRAYLALADHAIPMLQSGSGAPTEPPHPIRCFQDYLTEIVCLKE